VVRNTDILELINNIKGKRVAVVGIGVNNIPLIRFLVKRGANVTAFDQKAAKDLGIIYNDLKQIGITFSLGKNYLNKLTQKIIFKSPGIPFSIPEIQNAMADGAFITSEIEVFMTLCPCAVIGVTGSDGKTTTSTIIAKMLEDAGQKVWLGGNIGKPLIDELENISPNDKVVLELSSFQLQNCRVSPRVAVVTNISPNHLDHHADMQEYVDAKKNIFLHQDEMGILVTNSDNAITNNFRGHGALRKFSRFSEVESGCYLKDGDIHFKDEMGDFVAMQVADIKIPGAHNVENFMAAIAAVADFAGLKSMKEVAQTFNGVPHRIEFVREFKAIKFYNDSIATTPSRTMAGLKAFDKKVILIAGGYDKKIPFDDFGKAACENVKHLHLLGVTADKIAAAVGDSVTITKYDNLKEATIGAAETAADGDIVLLSPACASYDMFRNFEERGNYYKMVVDELR